MPSQQFHCHPSLAQVRLMDALHILATYRRGSVNWSHFQWKTLRKLLKITDFPVENSKKTMKYREKHSFF